MKLLSYLHDPDNLYVDLINETEIPDELKGSIVAVSESTTDKVSKMVEDAGFKIVEGGLYGTARLNALKHSLENGDENYYFVCDFDKMLHWLQKNDKEFLEILKYEPKNDMVVIGRSTKALSTYPETWVQTELIASRILAKIIKQKVDFMNGPCILNNEAAHIIADNAKEEGVGSCVEFCLLTHQAGLSVGNLEVDGLTWEDPDRYTELIDKSDSFEDWKYDTYHSLYEWRKRVNYLHKQVQVMIRLAEEPINPKYPAVRNKIFKGTPENF